MKRILSSKRGEGYVDVCVGVVVFVIVLVIGINIFSFVSERVKMDQIAEELLEAATYTGEFGEDFFDTEDYYLEDYDHYIDYGAPRYFNQPLYRVQLGERMWVKVYKQVNIKGIGGFQIPVTLTVTRSGLSEKYWK